MIPVLPLPAVAANESLVLKISGVEGELRANVEAALVVPERIVKDGVVNRLWLRRLTKQIPGTVDKALRPLGYYSANTSVSVLQSDGGNFTLNVSISPGPATTLSDLHLEITGAGRDEPLLKQRIAEFPLSQGDILRHDIYEQGKAGLESTAVDLGYIMAEFTSHSVKVDADQRQAKLALTLDTGPRYHVGTITFPSTAGYPERFLRRYLTIEPGTVFSYFSLGQTQSRLIDSDRFRTVVVSPQIDMAEGSRVPIEILLEPKPRRSLRPGVGYGTDTGARFSLLYQDINVWERGHKLEGDLLVAEIRQSLDLSYVMPHYKNVNSYTVLKVGFDREKTDTYISRILFAEAELIKKRASGHSLSFYARLQREDYEVGATDEVSQLLIPGVRWSRRTYQSPTRPDKGYHIAFEVRGTREDLLADTSLLQTIAQGNVLIPLPQRFSLFLRGQGATTVQQNEFESIPASLRFFAGGDQSVRGFEYQSLGPVDTNGDVIGGKHLLVGSIELERKLTKNWGLAIFYDTGNAFNNFSDYELARGAGAGLRWYTLIGPVKVDVARPLGEVDPSYRLHFSMGFTW